MATIRDVAKLAGVSVSTVSRVVNKSGYVNKETEDRVGRAIQILNYTPNAVARGLANKKTSTLALILPDITNPFFSQLSKSVENMARTYGYTVFLCNADDHAGNENYIEILNQKYIGGIVFATDMLGVKEVEYLERNDIPFVVLDRAPYGQYSVSSKNLSGAKLAVQHLLDIGCKKIGHIYGPQEISTAKERLIGYVESVKNFAWYTPTLMVPGNFELQGGMEAAQTLMKNHPDIDGIFVGNDLMAIGVLKTLLRLGFKVPEQVAICGFDGIFLTEMIEPELTTVAQPIFQMGALATQLLIQQIEGGVVDKKNFELEISLIRRKSTKRM